MQNPTPKSPRRGIRRVAWTALSTLAVAGTVWLGSGAALADGPRPGAPWPQFKRDGAKSSVSTVNGPSTLQQKWVANADSAIFGGPVISDDGTVYVVTENFRVVAFRPDGTRKWSFTPESVGGKFTPPMINAQNRVVFGTEDGYIIGVTSDGTQAWRFDTRNAPYGNSDPQTIVAPITGASNYGRILVPTYGGLVYELEDGVFAGVRRADGSIRAGAAVTPDGTLVWASLDRSVYGGLSAGGDKFKVTVDGPVLTTPAVGPDNVIYVTTEAGSVHAIQSDGTRNWNVRPGASKPLRGAPAVSPDGLAVYVGSDDGNLYALDAKTGTQKWAFPTGGALTGAPAIGPNGLIYLGSADRKLYVITPAGVMQSSVTTDGAIDLSSPAIAADGTLYAGSRDGRLYAYRDGGPPPTTPTVTAAAPVAQATPVPAGLVAPAPAPIPAPVPVFVPSTAPVPATEDGLFFFETGHNVRGPFLDFFNANGGILLFGYPRTEAILLPDGSEVQWFQRARMEYRASNGFVQLGLLGDELLTASGALR